MNIRNISNEKVTNNISDFNLTAFEIQYISPIAKHNDKHSQSIRKPGYSRLS